MMRDGGQPMSDSHILLAALDTVIGEEGATGSPKTNEGSSPSPDHVFTFADLLDDVERVRIANANRLAALTEGGAAGGGGGGAGGGGGGGGAGGGGGGGGEVGGGGRPPRPPAGRCRACGD